MRILGLIGTGSLVSTAKVSSWLDCGDVQKAIIANGKTIFSSKR